MLYLLPLLAFQDPLSIIYMPFRPNEFDSEPFPSETTLAAAPSITKLPIHSVTIPASDSPSQATPAPVPLETITVGRPWTTPEPRTYTVPAYRFPSFTSVAYVSYPHQGSDGPDGSQDLLYCPQPKGAVRSDFVVVFLGGMGAGIVLLALVLAVVRLVQSKRVSREAIFGKATTGNGGEGVVETVKRKLGFSKKQAVLLEGEEDAGTSSVSPSASS